MDKSFLAYRIHLTDGKIRGKLETLNRNELKLGDILVRVEYSGINYKDALAATGTGRVLREFPLIGGIDLAGEVLESSVARFRPGDKVLAIGCGQSETRDGGYTELARVNGECALHIPETMHTRTVMALGTAGFTAALAVHRMEEYGQRPELGPIVVTGATGGVGSIAIDLLSARGYRVTALTGKAEQHGYLESLGATETIDRKTLEARIKTAGTRALGWRCRQSRWRDSCLADAHRKTLGQYCEHRSRSQHGVADDRHAVHIARHQPARHQHGSRTRVACKVMGAPRERSQATPP